MCNGLRYEDDNQDPVATVGLKKVYEYWKIKEGLARFGKRYVVRPSMLAPVLTVQDGQGEITMKEFGFPTERGRQLMARGETVHQKPTFRKAFRDHRCLILANGFYDSLDMGAYKQPWHIHCKDDRLMFFAGLYRDSGSFTIVSAPANKTVLRVIDRMPVILEPEQCQRWLSPDANEEELKAMLKPYPDEPMEAYPVAREVNKPGFESPDAVKPVVPAQGELDLF